MSKYIKLDNSYVEVKIISPTVDPSHESYVVQLCVSGDIKEVSHENLLDYDPTPNSSSLDTKIPFPYLPWVTHEAWCILFLPDKMKEPKQGTLSISSNE